MTRRQATSSLTRLAKGLVWVWMCGAGWLLPHLAQGADSPAPGVATNLTAAAAPDLATGQWLNLPAGSSNSIPVLRGKVTILHFWTFGCINCRHNLPFYSRWQRAFDPHKVQIVGVHTPETEGEHDAEQVRRKVKELAITYPVLLDPERENWRRWQQRWWPAVYLVDKQGRVRYAWDGELEYNHAGGYAKLTRLIEALVRE